LIAVLLAAGALTTAPAPLRHVVYRVAVSYAIPVQGQSYAGTSSRVLATGGEGTITIDVLELANDGGMVVRASLQGDHQVRPRETVTCAVYDDRVICPSGAEVSLPLNVLLSLLGRHFYDPTSIKPDGTWTTGYEDGTVTLSTRFTRKTPDGVNPVTIDEHTDVTPKKSLGAAWYSDAQITYDAAMSLPDRVHDVATSKSRGGGTKWTTIDLTLLADSFAKK
jgi:hypothetical protein